MKEKENDKIWIFIWSAMAVIIILLLVLFVQKKIINKTPSEGNKNGSLENVEIGEFVKVESDGTKVNISEKFAEDKKFNDLEITNINLKEKGNITEILAVIKNNTDKDIEGQYVTLKFLDKEGNIIVSLGSYIPEVRANDTATLNTNSTGDFSNAYNFEIELTEE